MAISTTKQRQAIFDFGDGSTLYLLLEPDNLIDVADRFHLLNLILPNWLPVPGVSHSWDEVGTNDSDTWIEVSGVSATWTEVPTDD